MLPQEAALRRCGPKCVSLLQWRADEAEPLVLARAAYSMYRLGLYNKVSCCGTWHNNNKVSCCGAWHNNKVSCCGTCRCRVSSEGGVRARLADRCEGSATC